MQVTLSICNLLTFIIRFFFIFVYLLLLDVSALFLLLLKYMLVHVKADTAFLHDGCFQEHIG